MRKKYNLFPCWHFVMYVLQWHQLRTSRLYYVILLFIGSVEYLHTYCGCMDSVFAFPSLVEQINNKKRVHTCYIDNYVGFSRFSIETNKSQFNSNLVWLNTIQVLRAESNYFILYRFIQNVRAYWLVSFHLLL